MAGWVAPGEWLAGGGEVARAAATAPAPEVGELIEALAVDPRRLAALVGDPVAASALALAIARAAPAAWYPEGSPAAASLEPMLAAAESTAAAPGARPVVVLDGADPLQVMALARDLVAHRLHPRLLVLVPCTPAQAVELPRLAGNYPRKSILVAQLEAQPESPDARGLPPADRSQGGPASPSPREAGGGPGWGAPQGSLAADLAALMTDAHAAFHAGDVDTAAATFHRIAAGWRELGEVAAAIHALQCAADLERDRRDPPAAAACLEQALDLCQAIGDLPAAAHCLVRLGQFADRRADPRAAAAHYQAAITAYQQSGAPPQVLERLAADLTAARAAASAITDEPRPRGEPRP